MSNPFKVLVDHIDKHHEKLRIGVSGREGCGNQTLRVSTTTNKLALKIVYQYELIRHNVENPLRELDIISANRMDNWSSINPKVTPLSSIFDTMNSLKDVIHPDSFFVEDIFVAAVDKLDVKKAYIRAYRNESGGWYFQVILDVQDGGRSHIFDCSVIFHHLTTAELDYNKFLSRVRNNRSRAS